MISGSRALSTAFDRNSYCFVLSVVFLSLLMSQSQSSNSYRINVTREQKKASNGVFIMDFLDRKCLQLEESLYNACEKYCESYYEYVPSLPYKNAQKFDTKSQQCVPKKLCPRTYNVEYNETTGQCYDRLSGQEVDPVDAQPPNHPPEDLIEITYICQHGKVITFLDKLDCKCDLGYLTQYEPNLALRQGHIQIRKCNREVSIGAYFPNSYKIYYNEERDNMYPFADDPAYWFKLLCYYMRKAKYGLQTFFRPHQVEMVLFIIPQQEMIRSQDWVWVVWGLLVLFLILIFSLFQKLLYGVKKGELAEQQET